MLSPRGILSTNHRLFLSRCRLVSVALKLWSLRLHPSRWCRLAVFLILQTKFPCHTLPLVPIARCWLAVHLPPSRRFAISVPSPSEQGSPLSFTSLRVLLPLFHFYSWRLPFAPSPLPHAWEGHTPLGRVTSRNSTCLVSGKWIPILGAWGEDSRGPSFCANTSFWLFQAFFRLLAFFLAWLPAFFVLPGFWVDADYQHMVSDLPQPLPPAPLRRLGPFLPSAPSGRGRSSEG